MMKNILLLGLIVLSASSLKAQDSVKVRDVYINMHNKYISMLSSNAQKDDKNKLITHHDIGTGYLKLEKADSPTKIFLQLYKSDEAEWYVLVYTQKCTSGACTNQIKVYKTSDYSDVTNEVFKESDVSAKDVRKKVKDAYKDTYSSDDFFNENGYKKDEALLQALIWEVDRNNGLVSLKEIKLPFVIQLYAWNSRKAIFETSK